MLIITILIKALFELVIVVGYRGETVCPVINK